MGNLCIGDSRKAHKDKGFKKIRGRLNEHKEAKIIILGLDGAGKTALFNRFKGSSAEYADLKPTSGFNTEKVRFEGTLDPAPDGEYTIDLWELGGATAVRPFWKRYCKDKDGLVYVIDSEEEGRLEEAMGELKGLVEDPQLPVGSIPILLIASKQDQAGCASAESIKKRAEEVLSSSMDTSLITAQGCTLASEESNQVAQFHQQFSGFVARVRERKEERIREEEEAGMPGEVVLQDKE